MRGPGSSLTAFVLCIPPQPQSLVDELLFHKRSEDQIELKEKQLATMRVDVCSTETLKCLKGVGGRGVPAVGRGALSSLSRIPRALGEHLRESSLNEMWLRLCRTAQIGGWRL